jgi:DNA-binding MltR family transcriptional regulator
MLKYLVLALGAFSLPLFGEISMAEKLETQMWEDMKHRNFTAVEQNIADQFQSLHTFGALTRAGEIELIKDLYLGSYQISNLKVTENGDTLVVTYLISVAEKISNQSLSDKPAPRMSVWQKIKGKWQWIAHVNLKEVPTEKPKSNPV